MWYPALSLSHNLTRLGLQQGNLCMETTTRPTLPETLSIMKACEVADVSRRTIYNWIKDGKVDYMRTAGGSIRIFSATLFRGKDAKSGCMPFYTHTSIR